MWIKLHEKIQNINRLRVNDLIIFTEMMNRMLMPINQNRVIRNLLKYDLDCIASCLRIQANLVQW